ncbi:MAG: D-alanyl-D-alanine carboxypeptidase [Clostridiales bacterium]|nr:D-alanyl-D-alanine carboxypeptidase [Clostridiales bacterium]
MKKNKIISFVCLLFAIAFVFSIFASGLQAFFSVKSCVFAESATSAKSMCVMETSSKRVLESKNENLHLPMASTTKIMTAITAIENCKDLDKTFEISPKSVGISGTSIYLRKEEVMSTRDLLYGLMLVSGNDASVALAEHVGGSTKTFVALMNSLASKIGAYDTHFDNTHGLDSQTHYTTAKDLALITSYALENDTFREIVSTSNIKITNSDGKVRYLKNKNKLLSSLEGCCGVKTGFTNDAGRCLVSACERDGMRVVAVVLNCGPMFEESKILLEKAFEDYKLYNLINNLNIPQTIQVDEGRQDKVRIKLNGEFSYPLTEKEFDGVKYQINLQKSITAPVDKGTEVGEVKIFINNDLHFCEKIYTIENVRRNSIWQKIKDFVNRW